MSLPVLAGTLLGLAALVYTRGPLLWPRSFGVPRIARHAETEGEADTLPHDLLYT